MPYAPARPCRAPSCRHVVTHSKPCPVHGAAPTGMRWDATGPKPARIRGAKLQALRAALFAREPLCRVCAEAGRVTLATIRDHIVNLEEGGTEDEANCQPLCQACSDTKTHAESMRGQRRAR